ncbi:MAG: 2-oxoacid:acceptor oxidoreductase family protein [Proteobacteria bacterium]|nr:2-oxoacid:acceptor oxidoreductase family protein [Pseudomonadota bacterium]
MGKRYEIRLSGTGGQGVGLASIILAEAAMRKGRGQRVAQTVSYGPQVRGGYSDGEVVVSDEEIDHPMPIHLDLLIPFNQDSADQGARLLKPDGFTLMDPALVNRRPEGWVAVLPLTELARESTGRAMMANITALGAVSALCPVIDAKSLNEAIEARAPEGMAQTFLAAAEAGRKAARKIKKRMSFEKPPLQDD